MNLILTETPVEVRGSRFSFMTFKFRIFMKESKEKREALINPNTSVQNLTISPSFRQQYFILNIPSKTKILSFFRLVSIVFPFRLDGFSKIEILP